MTKKSGLSQYPKVLGQPLAYVKINGVILIELVKLYEVNTQNCIVKLKAIITIRTLVQYPLWITTRI